MWAQGKGGQGKNAGQRVNSFPRLGPTALGHHSHVLLSQDDSVDVVCVHHAQDAAAEDPRGRVRGVHLFLLLRCLKQAGRESSVYTREWGRWGRKEGLGTLGPMTVSPGSNHPSLSFVHDPEDSGGIERMYI